MAQSTKKTEETDELIKARYEQYKKSVDEQHESSYKTPPEEKMKNNVAVGLVIAGLVILAIWFFFFYHPNAATQAQLYDTPDCQGGGQYCN